MCLEGVQGCVECVGLVCVECVEVECVWSVCECVVMHICVGCVCVLPAIEGVLHKTQSMQAVFFFSPYRFS